MNGALIVNAREVLTRYSFKLGETRVSLRDVTHFEADCKYVTVHAAGREYLTCATLLQIEAFLGEQVLRVHRSVLVMRQRVRAITYETRTMTLHGLDKPVRASRRRWATLRSAVCKAATRPGCSA